MIKTFSISLLVLTSIFMFSCTDINKPKQMEKIQNMNNSLDSLEKVILANPMDSANNLALITSDVELRIKNHYFADTIDLTLGKKMDAYKIMRRSWAPLGFDYTNLLKGVKETRESLRQLKYDIENGDGHRSEYEEYLAFEQNKVTQLCELGKEYIDVRKKSFRTFNELHDELNAFSFELVKKAEKRGR